MRSDGKVSLLKGVGNETYMMGCLHVMRGAALNRIFS